MKVSPSFPGASTSKAWSLMGGHRAVPPSWGKQQFVVGAWAVATPPGWGGRGESPSGAWPPAGTLSQAACPCRAHPCPSLPASPTLSPALSTRHTSPGGLAPFPSFMGSKGQAEGWQQGAASLPPLPPAWDAALGPQASWTCDGQGCSITAPRPAPPLPAPPLLHGPMLPAPPLPAPPLPVPPLPAPLLLSGPMLPTPPLPAPPDCCSLSSRCLHHLCCASAAP